MRCVIGIHKHKHGLTGKHSFAIPIHGPVRALTARCGGGGDRPAGPKVWGAAAVRKRPSPTCEESGKARLERLAPGTPRRAWAKADARFIQASLRGRPRQGETPILCGTDGPRPARPAARWSGLGPGV